MIRLVQAAEELLSQAERRILAGGPCRRAHRLRRRFASGVAVVLLHRAAGPEAAPAAAGCWIAQLRPWPWSWSTTQRLSRWARCGVATPTSDRAPRPAPWCCRPRRLPKPVASLDSGLAQITVFMILQPGRLEPGGR